jgi:two-component system uhpT operon response regulator UhpA
MRAVAAVRENRRHLGPLIRDLLARPRATPPGLLTIRERQVLAMIAKGNTDKEIAARLELSPRTIHTYRTSIMSKLRVHNVIALVRRALELGLVTALLIAVSP